MTLTFRLTYAETMARFRLIQPPLLALAVLLLSGCPRRPVESPEEGAPLDNPRPEDVGQKLDATATTFAPGARRIDLFQGEAMTEDEQQSFGANLLAETCYWLIGVGESSIDELTIYLYNPSGSRVDESKNTMRPMLHFCPKNPGRYMFKVGVPKGKGNYHVGLYTKP